MRVLLVYPDIKIHVNYPLGLGMISAILKNHGHKTRILHFNEEIESPFDMSIIERNVIDFQPQLIAFSSVSNQFQYVEKIAEYIKRNWELPTLVGGIHATIAPEKVLQNGCIDLICQGEGEFAILDVITRIEKGEDYSRVPNIGLKRDGKIRVNPVRPLIDVETLDSLPSPDREGFDFDKIIAKKRGWANVMASRGCLNQCTYCVNHYYHQLYSEFHKRPDILRYRKVDTVIKELEELLDDYPGIQLINLDDDNITWNKKWLFEFCDAYAEKIALPFACNVHPVTFNPKIADVLAKAGCVEVKIGLESGSERLRRDILKRPSKEEVMIKAFKAADDVGIRAWAFNMIGLPTETKEEMLMTAELNAKIRPYIVRCSIFFPYEGTDLYHYAVEHKLLKPEIADKVSSHLEDTALVMPQLPRCEILKFKTLFKWYVDAYSDVEAAPFFRQLISIFEKLPKEAWLNGKARTLFQRVDKEIDLLLRDSKMEHYATRKHLDLNFTEKLNYELP
jgi:anaerobic magnesium-protoporphyrin IX monomethyl ester cyclase